MERGRSCEAEFDWEKSKKKRKEKKLYRTIALLRATRTQMWNDTKGRDVQELIVESWELSHRGNMHKQKAGVKKQTHAHTIA